MDNNFLDLVSSITYVQVFDGEMLQLRCPVDILLVTNLLWRRTVHGYDNISPDISKSWNITSPSLVIKPIRWFHYGTYGCHAATNIGNNTYLFEINVIASK